MAGLVPLLGLTQTRQQLHADIRQRLTGDIAAFLLALHDAEPNFDLIGLSDAAQLPAIRWKLLNLEKLKHNDPKKHAEQRDQLQRLLQ